MRRVGGRDAEFPCCKPSIESTFCAMAMDHVRAEFFGNTPDKPDSRQVSETWLPRDRRAVNAEAAVGFHALEHAGRKLPTLAGIAENSDVMSHFMLSASEVADMPEKATHWASKNVKNAHCRAVPQPERLARTSVLARK
jgi:hypothetical protein